MRHSDSKRQPSQDKAASGGRQLWGALSWIKLADRYMDQIDFWGVNLYTRRYFSPMGLFQRYHLVSKRPFLITEYGDAFSLNPQLEGLNGYDTMGDEDEISQADWLSTMVEDIERHSTSCKAGCGVRFASGGAIMSWVDEYWKGKAVTPVPTNDERIPTITRVCPSLKEYLHSPCGYMSPTQPDLYVSEEWFGIMALKRNVASIKLISYDRGRRTSCSNCFGRMAVVARFITGKITRRPMTQICFRIVQNL